ncbi:Transmembrane domain-containing protein [Giardia muris]|uniref:Transmembrane domain-containing protein n=1 Tax=Giardia muris TaxID=5742 RepID=A0A4Z1SMJ9_GIAMU|nr:Transmembrane domain-containing protein [Giardia muris]|eukprot:TNJ26916.1 Transmembrane domain-containing protein [Giardia muris]
MTDPEQMSIIAGFDTGDSALIEVTLLRTLGIHFTLAFITLLLFNVIRYLFPTFFAPRYKRRMRVSQHWYIEVFKTPIAQYARQGNMAAMYVIYQTMLIVLFGLMSILSLLVLIPLYLLGVDQSFQVPYRTFWGVISMSHIEDGSILVIVPIVVATVFTVMILDFYYQFQLTYIYFKQRVMRRAAPQNYVVMLENLPSNIRTYEDLVLSLEDIFADGVVRKIVCTPDACFMLRKKHKHLLSLIQGQHRCQAWMQQYTAQLLALEVQRLTDSTAYQSLRRKHAAREAELLSLRDRAYKVKMQILRYAFSRNMDLTYLSRIKHLPPQLPLVVTSFLYITHNTRMTELELEEYNLGLVLPSSRLDFSTRGTTSTDIRASPSFDLPRVDSADKSFWALSLGQRASGLALPMLQPTMTNQTSPLRTLTTLTGNPPTISFELDSTPSTSPSFITTIQDKPEVQPVRQIRPVLTRYTRNVPRELNRFYEKVPRSGFPVDVAHRLQRSIRTRKLDHKDIPIGTTAFLIFRSQLEAATSSRALLYLNSYRPKASLAPDPNQIKWRNFSWKRQTRTVFYVVFIQISANLFVLYFAPQVTIVNVIKSYQAEWLRNFFNRFCVRGKGEECPKMPEDGNFSKPKDFKCLLCYYITSSIINSLPSLVQIVFMAILPNIIHWLTYLPMYTSRNHKAIVEYRLLFYFLILIIGILQIMVSSLFDNNGIINVLIFSELSLSQLIWNMGRNFPSQLFVFINYIIVKYFLFVVLSLLRLGDIMTTLIRLFRMRDPLSRRHVVATKGFPYATQLAYSSHMFVLGIMYAIVAPISMPFILLIFTFFSAVNRYNILYVYSPKPCSEMTSETDIMRYAVNDSFIGCCLMLICTGTFLYVHSSTAFRAGAYYLFLILVVIIFFKGYIDHRLKLAMTTLHLSNWDAKNPCHIAPYDSARDIDHRHRFFAEKHTLNVQGCTDDCGRQRDDLQRQAIEEAPTKDEASLLKRLFQFRKTVLQPLRYLPVSASAVNCRFDLAHPPVSYMRASSLLWNEYQCELGNEESVATHVLSDQEVEHIAAQYTHPAIQLAYVYNSPASDMLIN